MKRAHVLVAAGVIATACKPDLGPGDSLVTGTRVLAVHVDPPEAPAGSSATYTALVATTDGTFALASIGWSFCTAPKPVGENNAVSNACLDPSSLVAAGTGTRVTVSTPKDACALFGPDTPPGGFRPRDPDATGGYYQPMRLDLTGVDPTFELTRVQCNLANAPADIASAFADAYAPNKNPKLLLLTNASDAVRAGAKTSFAASWGDADAETYAYFDAASQSLSTKRESLRVAWYATDGTFDSESTGRAEDDLQTSSSNGWTAPANVGVVHMWIVLRDSRGGVDFAAYDINVE
jgi:hypothetical protein